MKPNTKVNFEPYVYLILPLICLGIFTYFPFFKTIYLSFNTTNMNGKGVKFVGLKNYIDLLGSASFLNDISVTFKLVILVAIPSMVLGLILAILASEKVKGSRVFSVVYSLPMSVSSSSMAIIWGILFHPTIGVINSILNKQIDWISNPKLAIFSIATITIWLNLGINFIFIYTAFKNISLHILESAKIDGLGFFNTLFKIKLPLISPTIFFLVFINIINAFQVFAPIHILTRGGPANSTNSLVYSIYLDAFFNDRFDMAATKSIILFIVMILFTFLQFRFEGKGVHYR